ncbi:MAG TPA: SIR2 family protein [Terriglobales bacterium]|nr:SIR2 family protein [Terriglobales bacterium]
MPNDELQKNWIPHLRGQFERGRPILFTGAGFSLAVRNTAGDSIPSYSDIKRRLWELCFPGDPFDNNSGLQDLYEHAYLRHRKQLSEILRRSFTVDSNTIPEWYRLYFELPWQRAYTLNIDDLDTAANSAFELPRKTVSISATNPAGAVIGAQQRKLEFVHLNGNLDDIPEYVTFSVTQYADRARTDPWYIRFTADLVTSPVIFIGTRLEEPPLWQHLVLRHGRGGRELHELRHRSYLVTPALDRPKQALLAQYNVVWLEMDAETFANEVLKQVEPVAQEGLKILLQAPDEYGRGGDLPEVTRLAINPGEANEFLMALSRFGQTSNRGGLYNVKSTTHSGRPRRASAPRQVLKAFSC